MQRIGPGRLAQVLEVGTTREVSIAEAQATPRGAVPVVKKIRDYHHNIARCAAMGMRPGEIAVAMAMSPARVLIMLEDPAFRELVEHYRGMLDETWKQSSVGTFGLMMENHSRAQRLIAAELEDAEDKGKEIPLGTLSKIASDLADRVGYGKHSIVTVDNSFAARLDRAIDRSSKVIEHVPLAVGESSPEGQDRAPMVSVSSGERRRA